jgi:glycosyltransferase involved in cell wall biosynthesis
MASHCTESSAHRMRILQLCSAREIGGGERHVIDLVNGLARRGHDVFAGLRPDSPLTDKLTELPPQNVIELPMPNALRVTTAAKLVRFARKNQIKIVHAHVARDYPLAALIAIRAGSSLILTRHLLFPLNRIHRLTLRRAGSVIAVSHAVAESLRARRIFRDDQIVVIHNGIDVDHFAARTSRPKPAERLRVGTVGYLAPIKGQEDFIRAAAIVCAKRADVDFVLAGEDKSRTRKNRRVLEHLVGALGLNQRVGLMSWVDDVADFLSTLDIFVSPARSESFGVSIVEAMAAGVPVIATMSEGASEIIDTGVTGRFVPVADPAGMANAISELLDDESLRQSLAANATRAVRERFSLEQMLEATESVYRRALGQLAR